MNTHWRALCAYVTTHLIIILSAPCPILPQNEPVNDQKSAPDLPIENNNNKNDLAQRNFEQLFIVIFVIVKHMCAQFRDLLRILRARFMRKWDIVQCAPCCYSSSIMDYNHHCVWSSP